MDLLLQWPPDQVFDTVSNVLGSITRSPHKEDFPFSPFKKNSKTQKGKEKKHDIKEHGRGIFLAQKRIDLRQDPAAKHIADGTQYQPADKIFLSGKQTGIYAFHDK